MNRRAAPKFPVEPNGKGQSLTAIKRTARPSVIKLTWSFLNVACSAFKKDPSREGVKKINAGSDSRQLFGQSHFNRIASLIQHIQTGIRHVARRRLRYCNFLRHQ